MTQSPRILVTNDDGIDAPGLAVLKQIAETISDDVWVVAPGGNQSGAGHRFSFGRELTAQKRDDRSYAIDTASPADCVVYGCTHLLVDRKPDIVLSGVNNGQNLGDIVHCSGTAAGAREGAMQGALGIALSQAVDYAHTREVHWDVAGRFGAAIVRQLHAEFRPGSDIYYNVNFPLGRPEDVSGIRLVPHQRFAHSPFGYYASDNPDHFFIAIPKTPLPLDREADFEVLHRDRAITVTPLTLVQTDEAERQRLSGKLALD
ncbi:5'-nucleotidase SurE [Devosia pacifica]|uniref:5'-nucleotidase SurE n=1 Tax=Devosia pacifica TaxID=1335967 RepID=A0A918RU45_9HYPH|nr:5'/3'-nucleotidase SurE [Devosia pacifica]GHA11029.1 5'-nucleotidase SurE [Devosia pacifica]